MKITTGVCAARFFSPAIAAKLLGISGRGVAASVQRVLGVFKCSLRRLRGTAQHPILRLLAGLTLLLTVALPAPAQAAVPYRCTEGIDCGGSGAPIQPATLSDYGIGVGNIQLDGFTKYVRVSFFDAEFGGTRRADALYQLDHPSCGIGQYGYSVPLEGVYCYSPYDFDVWVLFYYPHGGAAGRWRYEFRQGASPDEPPAEVIPFDMRPATLHKFSGDQQVGVINQALTVPLGLQLKDVDGNPVHFPYFFERYNRYAQKSFTYTITSPGGASGASASFVAESYPHGSDGTASLKLILGNKPGTYTVKVSHPDAGGVQMSFTAEAVLELPPPEPPISVDEERGAPTPADTEATRGDPIIVTTGNNLHVETDYPRTGLSLLEFKRSYNSIAGKSRLMGNYWTTTFDRYVVAPADSNEAVRLQRPDGKTVHFTSLAGGYQAQPHFLGRLVKTASGWTYIDEDQTVENYDALGKLLSIRDLQGRTLTISYDRRSGRMSAVTANTSESLSFQYNSSGRLASITDHSSRVWTYSYDGWVNLVQVKTPDGLYWTHHHESPYGSRLLTGVSVGRSASPSPSERQVTWGYDPQGRATSSYLPYGSRQLERVDISYSGDTAREVRYGDGTEETMNTSRINNQTWLGSVLGPAQSGAGQSDLSRQFDAQMNITSVTKHGLTSVFAGYDAQRQPRFRVDRPGTASERRVDFEYDLRFINHPTRITEPSVSAGRTKTTGITYNSQGNPERVTITGFTPDGVPVAGSYNYLYQGPYGQLSQVDGPRTDVSDITRIEYDSANGRALRVIDANGIVQRSNISYTSTGKIKSETRPNGLILGYAYYPGSDLLQSLTQTQGGASQKTTWTYSDRRFVESITFSDGVNTDQSLRFSYDPAGKLLSVSSPATAGYSADTSYLTFRTDERGNTVEETAQRANSNTRWVQRSFDAYNRLDRVIAANNGTDYDYRPDGTLERVVDGRSNATSYQYDDFLRLTRIVEPGSVASSFAYDVHGQLIQTTAANGAETRYSYDDLGNRLFQQSPDSGMTYFAYDTAGNLIGASDAKGQATAYSYDAGNRLLAIDRAGTDYDETYSYDSCANGIGQLCSTSNGAGEIITYAYNGFGQIAQLTSAAGTVGFAYNAGGAIIRLSYPSGRAVLYDYNAEGKIGRVRLEENGATGILADQVRHQPFGPVLGWTYGNGLNHSRSHDQQYWLRSQQTVGVINRSYSGYDGNGNLTALSENGSAQQFAYDSRNRLESAAGSFGQRSYSYDANGNRSSQVADGASTLYLYAPSSNRLISDSTWTYSLDANGNRIAQRAADGSGREYDYSPHNRLLAVRDAASSAELAQYRYNPLGQRTAKTVASQTTQYAYGLGGELLAERDSSGIVQEYVYLEGQPLALLGRPQAPPPGVAFDVVVDNDPVNGDWASKGDRSAINGDYLLLNQRKQNYLDQQNWRWNVSNGNYDVYVLWIAPKTSDPTLFTSYTVNGQAVTVANAGQVKGSWVKLGNYFFAAGPVQVQLKEDTQQTLTLYADAARLVRTATASTTSVQYVHTDHLGTPQAVTDSGGRIVWRATLEPFGGVTQLNEDADGDGVAVTLNLRAPGQYFDTESGFYYNHFRDYDPATGRYLESDPIGLMGGMNPYAYVGGNPVSRIDPLGLWPDTHEDLMGFYYWHFGRNELNGNPAFDNEAQVPSDWIRMSDWASRYHRIGPGNEHNRKYISPNGHSEDVFHDDGSFVSDPVNRGTYNYAPPSDWIGHFLYDMAPYYIFGNDAPPGSPLGPSP